MWLLTSRGVTQGRCRSCRTDTVRKITGRRILRRGRTRLQAICDLASDQGELAFVPMS